jgi:hypothetical protein
MRGWKAVNFDQFHIVCDEWKRVAVGKLICNSESNSYAGCDCCPTFCHKWRKLGRAGIRVVKVTAHNKPSAAVVKHSVCMSCGGSGCGDCHDGIVP